MVHPFSCLPIRTFAFAFAIVAAACGEVAKESTPRTSESDAGESGPENPESQGPGAAGTRGDGGPGGAGSGGGGHGGGGAAGSAGSSGAEGASPGGAGSGGVVTGGTSSGGAPSDGGGGGEPAPGQGGAVATGAAGQGGVSGVAGASSVAVPESCTYTNHLEGDLFCSIEMGCGSERVLISCDEDAGPWRCGCLRGDVRNGPYYFTETVGMRTCEVAAAACADPELLAVDEVCTLSDSTEPGSCVATDSCVRTHEIDGIAFETRSEWTASCEPCPIPDHACCFCADGDYPDYRFVSSDVGESCLFLDELCRNGGEVTPLGGEACSTLTQEVTPGTHCAVETSCTYPSELADGTGLTRADSFLVSCGSVDGPELEPVTLCRCTDEIGRDTLNVVYEEPEIELAKCADANRACAGLESVEELGAADCGEGAVPSSNAETECHRDRRCLQPATLLGQQVSVVTGARVSCYLEDDVGWSCSCHDRVGNQDYVTVEIEASLESESVCAEAIMGCPMVSKATF